jgi:hypothetical protein
VLSRLHQIYDYFKAALKSLGPIGNGIYDSSVMALAAKDYSKKAFKNNAVAQVIFTVPVSLFAFGQSIGLNYTETIEGIDETLDALADRKVPAVWTPLPRSKEQFALMIGLLITVFVAMGDFCGGVFFISTLPEDYDLEQDVNPYYWQLLCIATGIVAAITTAFTEGFGAYKEVRSVVAGEFTAHATTMPGMLIGYPLVVFAGLEAACETYSGMKNTIPGSSTLYLKYLLLIPAVAKILSDFCFPGKLTLSAIDEFILDMQDVITKTREEYVDVDQLKELMWEARAEIAAFISTTGAAVWVEYSQCALTDDLLVDEATKLPFDVPYFMRETLGWSATLRDGILQMATLYPLFLYLTQNALTNRSPDSPGDTVRPYHSKLMKKTLLLWRENKEHVARGSTVELEDLLKVTKPRYGSTHWVSQ